ncbi:MAG: ABC transporter permease subunit [Tildeniella nuda ZEHNDER 1965/U140]|jgi:phosphonate transport system permease protein|nr:ABC transporter permease subunit [Tildeniella nuda ZEHNDER 1965/U140]
MRTIVPRQPGFTAPLGWGLLGLGAIVLSLLAAGLFQRELLNVAGFPQLWQFLQAAIHPDLSQALLQVTLSATVTTFAYAVCGTLFSLILGAIGGILLSQVWWESVFSRRQPQASSWWYGIRLLLAVPRAIHELIWGLFFINLWGLDPLTAILAIAIPFGAITAKVFAEILDETPRQPLQVLLNSGVSAPIAFCYGLLPLAGLNLVSYAFYRFECSIRSAAVLGIVGAGGLGYEILLSLQSLQYEQLWTFFYALFLLNGLVDFGSARVRRFLNCANRLDLHLPSSRRSTQPPMQRSSRNTRLQGSTIGLTILGLMLFSFWSIHPDYSKLWATRTRQLLGALARSSMPPDWSLLPQLLPLSMETVAMSILAIALAGLGGMLLAFLAASNVLLPGGVLNPGRQANRWVAAGLFLLTRAALLLARAIPAPIWALVALFVLFPGILPGAVALGIHNLGILGRLKAETIENLDTRPLEALKAQGAPGSLVFLYGVLPLSLPRFLAYDLYRWEVCMRETVIVGLVGAGGLGRLLTEQLSSFDYRGTIVTLGSFLLLTFLVDAISAQVRRSLR